MARDDDDDDAIEAEDRPRKKNSGDEDDDTHSPEKKPLPARLIAAAVASMAWGFLNLHSSCVSTTNSFHGLIMSRFRRNPFGDDIVFPGQPSQGVFWTLAFVSLFFFVLSAVLLAGGSLLLLRKGFAKFMVMGAPILYILVGLLGFAVGLFFSSGNYMFLASQFNGLLLNCLFSLIVGVLNCVLLLNKDVSKALK